VDYQAVTVYERESDIMEREDDKENESKHECYTTMAKLP
jgi:hypothetical protein